MIHKHQDDPIIDKLNDIWTKDEIKAIDELLSLILNDKNKEIYIKIIRRYEYLQKKKL